ncbi:NUDIX hydrolase domain-like protein [Scenedesmus sp. NREL 46B-D3]|nr:NUDIX hydrolase domain-like protein [Scenedesmus sp. NREL 46B-D3]
MHRSVSAHNKTLLYTIGFAGGAADVPQQHTVWQHLQDRFQVTNFPIQANLQQQVSADYDREARESTGRVAAAVIAPIEQQLQIAQTLRTASATLFIACWHPKATEDAAVRWRAFQAGANMVTHCRHALAEALHKISQQQQHHNELDLGGLGQEAAASAAAAAAAAAQNCMCDWCGLPGLSPAEYWFHQQLYHIHHANKSGTCQVCGKHSHNLARHLHDSHDPAGTPPEERTGVFALAIVRRPSDGKFLMTQEFAGSGFWVPGGGVDAGESLEEGAVRECLEEAGVAVALRGILDLESHHGGAWRRVIFLAEPVPAAAAAAACADGSSTMSCTGGAAGGCLQQQQQQQDPGSSSSSQGRSSLGAHPCCSPKTLPDWESAGACWVAASELSQLPLRNASEPCRWFSLLAGGVEGLKEQLPLIDSLDLPTDWAEGVFRGFPCRHSSSDR